MWTYCCSQLTPCSSMVRPCSKSQLSMVTAVQLLLHCLRQPKQPACTQSTDAPIGIGVCNDSPARLGHCSAFAIFWARQPASSDSPA